MATLFELLRSGIYFNLKVEFSKDDSVRGKIYSDKKPFEFIVTRSNPDVMEKQGSAIDFLNKTIHSEDSKESFKKINENCQLFEESKEEILKETISKAYHLLRLKGYKAMLEYIENESGIEIIPKFKDDGI